jgi:hypothetical protein
MLSLVKDYLILTGFAQNCFFVTAIQLKIAVYKQQFYEFLINQINYFVNLCAFVPSWHLKLQLPKNQPRHQQCNENVKHLGC